jgi:hypothetical protein
VRKATQWHTRKATDVTQNEYRLGAHNQSGSMGASAAFGSLWSKQIWYDRCNSRTKSSTARLIITFWRRDCDSGTWDSRSVGTNNWSTSSTDPRRSLLDCLDEIYLEKEFELDYLASKYNRSYQKQYCPSKSSTGGLIITFR